MKKLLPEERAFVDAFWGSGWTIPQAEKALAALLEWKTGRLHTALIDAMTALEVKNEARAYKVLTDALLADGVPLPGGDER